ncbi:MAG TPA: DMT family transporter [Gemmatimonadaceae bacterium]|nr:DMT family transporter [Gemmatimonadaceae bacterium]
MELATYGLVLASSVIHAYWNFLLKRSGGGPAFVGLSKVLEVAAFAPVFALWALPGAREHLDAWPVVVVGALLTLANYAALARAYQLGDLAVAYPVARGSTLLFLPFLGFLVFAERLSAVGWLSIACIVVGIVVLQLPALTREAVLSLGPSFRNPSVVFAMAAGLAAAGYTVWDKRAVQRLPAFTYFYAYTAIVAAAYAGFVYRRYPRAEVRAEWRTHWWPMLQVAVCNTIAYLLVLGALRSGTSSYVIALRQLSIAIGAVMGWRLLGERFGAARRLGVGLIVLGCLLVAMAQ